MTDLSAGRDQVYRSVFLDDGWANQKYLGWNLVENRPGLRILQKKRFAFTRCLMLLTKGGETWVDEAVARRCERPDCVDIIVHDFDGILPDPPMLAGRCFRRSEQRERLLNIATYVIDLEESEETLWKKFGGKNRNLVRKAEFNGVRFVSDSDGTTLLEQFIELYHPIAQRNNLKTPSYKLLEEMQKGGNLMCVGCEDSEGKTCSVNVIYGTNRSSYFMYGARDCARRKIAGQFMQWESFRLLRKKGYKWYDLGGVADEPGMNGINRFKKSLGGKLYNLGVEYIYETPTLALARAAFQRRA